MSSLNSLTILIMINTWRTLRLDRFSQLSRIESMRSRKIKIGKKILPRSGIKQVKMKRTSQRQLYRKQRREVYTHTVSTIFKFSEFRIICLQKKCSFIQVKSKLGQKHQVTKKGRVGQINHNIKERAHCRRQSSSSNCCRNAQGKLKAQRSSFKSINQEDYRKGS